MRENLLWFNLSIRTQALYTPPDSIAADRFTPFIDEDCPMCYASKLTVTVQLFL